MEMCVTFPEEGGLGLDALICRMRLDSQWWGLTELGRGRDFSGRYLCQTHTRPG
jgi:hypothetical protein